MTYIIENANILKGRETKISSLLVHNGQITAIKQSFKRYAYMKMNVSSFIMTSTPILLKNSLPMQSSYIEMKNYFIQEFILKGCTTFLTIANIHSESVLQTELKRLKARLLNCPMDYIIGVQIPIRLITQSFLRKCKREKVPAIFVEIQQMDELYQLPWGWIREAMFPYNSPLIPVFLTDNLREKKQFQLKWQKLMEEEKIPFIENELNEDEPLANSILAKIGIYPFKGNIQHGQELSYNLYMKSTEIEMIEEMELFSYHNNKLAVTVHKGEVIRANEQILFRPGFGEHVKIKTPSYIKIDV